MMKKITLAEAVASLQVLEKLAPKMKGVNLYEVNKVRKALQDSIEVARPLVTGDEKKTSGLPRRQPCRLNHWSCVKFSRVSRK